MKVLLIAPAPPPAGGIQSVTENMVNYLKSCSNGTVLRLYNTTHQYRRMTSQSLFVRLYTGVINSLKTYLKVAEIIKKDVPDIIHLASSSSLALFKDLLIVKTACRSKIPVVLHWHFGRIPELQQKSNWEWKILKRVIRKSSVSIVIDKKSYHTLINVGFNNVEYIPNPLALDIETKAREFIGNSNHRRHDRLIYVGHIIKEKGVFELVEACLHIPIVKELIFIGPCEEPVKQELLKIARHRKSDNWLNFTGELNMDEVIDYMKQSSILALPSYTEGFPMVLLEAMAMGCVIIASDVGAIPEMLAMNTPFPCGICIPPKNREKLMEAILNLTKNTDELKTISNRAYDRVLTTYTIGNVFAQYKKVWEKAIRGNKVSHNL